MKPRKPGKYTGHHVRLYDWMTDSPAWQSLSALARATLLEVMKRYVGDNNGKIPLSVREVAAAFHIGKTTAAAAFAELQDRGFLAVAQKGAFSVKHRRATEWRLTEFTCNVTGELPSKEFMRWHLQK